MVRMVLSVCLCGSVQPAHVVQAVIDNQDLPAGLRWVASSPCWVLRPRDTKTLQRKVPSAGSTQDKGRYSGCPSGCLLTAPVLRRGISRSHSRLFGQPSSALLQAREKVNRSTSAGLGLCAAAPPRCGLYESKAGQPRVVLRLEQGVKWQELGQQGALRGRSVL